MIYFDSASTAFFLDEEMLNMLANYKYISPYRSSPNASFSSELMIHETRRLIAEIINADSPSNVVFTSGATQGMNLLLDSLIPKEATLITTYNEHNSVIRPLNRLARYKGCEIHMVSNKLDGEINLIELEALLINTKPFAMVLNHVSNVTGIAQNISAITSLCHKYDTYVILDAAQSVAFLDIDMKKDNIDALVFSGHKHLSGLMGIGVMIIGNNLALEPKEEVISGGTGHLSFDSKQPRELPIFFEAGTPNIPGILSLNYTFHKLQKNLTINNGAYFAKRMSLLNYAKSFRDALNTINGYETYPTKLDVCIEEEKILSAAIVPFNYTGISSQELEQKLGDRVDVVCRSGFHCAPYVHKFFQTDKRGMLRFSFSYQNTDEELSTVLNALEDISKDLRK